jgi:two-component system, OmpR family, sensor histidine kinase KdpD
VTVFDGNEAIDALAAASPIDLAAARWALAHGDPAGRGAPTMSSADSLFFSTGAGDVRALLVRLWRGDTLTPVPPSRLGVIQQLVDRCGEAVERLGVVNARRAIEAREGQDAMRDALLASFSHDMRTPLTTITSGLSGLAADPGNGDALSAAQDGAVQLERLFANLVDLARIRAGAVSLTLEPVDLTDSISAALEAVARQTAGRALSVTLPETMPLVHSDARLLHHMLVNLLDNVCKHTPTDTAVDVLVSEREGGLVLSIQDHGPGLGGDDKADLFTAFARGMASDRTPGSGLGLAIVAGFARALGITVSAANRTDGAGASFSLHFPAATIFDAGKAGDA